MTCCGASRRAPGRLALVLLLATTVAGAAGCASGAPARAPRDTPAESLTNTFLSPRYSGWLVGPVARLATTDEIAAYLELDDDFAAVDFIEAFWSRRDPDPETPENELRRTFEERAAEADRRWSEAGYLGRRTARGTTHVLYGAPEKTEFDIADDPGPPIEVWTYPAGAPEGLDGRPPARTYRFRQQGDLTGFYQPAVKPLSRSRRRGPP